MSYVVESHPHHSCATSKWKQVTDEEGLWDDICMCHWPSTASLQSEQIYDFIKLPPLTPIPATTSPQPKNESRGRERNIHGPVHNLCFLRLCTSLPLQDMVCVGVCQRQWQRYVRTEATLRRMQSTFRTMIPAASSTILCQAAFNNPTAYGVSQTGESVR